MFSFISQPKGGEGGGEDFGLCTTFTVAFTDLYVGLYPDLYADVFAVFLLDFIHDFSTNFLGDIAYYLGNSFLYQIVSILCVLFDMICTTDFTTVFSRRLSKQLHVELCKFHDGLYLWNL